MLEAVVLAVALSMDATAVAAARSVSGVARRDLFVLATCFGLFQSGMAAAGLGLGKGAASWVASWDHWLAFGLLAGVGGKMIVEALRGGDDDDPPEDGPTRLGARTIVVLSIATSIDAFAAGITLPTVAAPIGLALILIGVVTFALSGVGALAGSALGKHLSSKLEVAGGVALIAIGIKTLVDHLR